jgi:hypothetical protein
MASALDWDEWPLIQLFSAGSKTNDQQLQILRKRRLFAQGARELCPRELVFPTRVGQEYETAERQVKSHLVSAFRQDQPKRKCSSRRRWV